MRGRGRTVRKTAAKRRGLEWARMRLCLMCWASAFRLGAQLPSLSTWEIGAVVWCGEEEIWSWDFEGDSMPVHRMQGSPAGRHVLWGCPTTSNASSTSAWNAAVLWSQQVAGSASNRSAVRWATSPSDDPHEAALLLHQSHTAGWLDDTGGVGAGASGSADPLLCDAPGLSEWSVDPSCHTWADPFEHRGTWIWTADGHWTVVAQDQSHRIDTWVDTSIAMPLAGPPCIGIEVNHTSSYGSHWGFGWQPFATASMADSTSTLLFQLMDSLTLGCQSSHPIAPPMALNLRMRCDDGPAPVHHTMTTTTCDNVQTMTLPCPLAAGSSVLVQTDGASETLWRDGSSRLKPGHLCFTEVMADPTPAQFAPASTYLEVLNDSPWAICPEKLLLRDSDNDHSLVWVRSPKDGLLRPGERAVLVDSPSPWLDEPWGASNVLRVVGWGGLRDAGETVALVNDDGNVLEDLTYWASWWGDMGQDGQSLSCAHPQGCDHPWNWKPDPHGASPGAPSTLESDLGTAPQAVSFKRTPHHTVSVTTTPPLHPHQVPLVSISWGDRSMVRPLTWTWDELGTHDWQFSWPKGAPTRVALQLSNLTTCKGEDILLSVDTVWSGHAPPRPSDVQVTEILPVAHPSTGVEFVEWTNVSQDTLAWDEATWLPGASLVQCNRPRTALASWMGSSWLADSSGVLWECHPQLALSNVSGEVSLTDEWGQTLCTLRYSECHHSRSDGTASGRSLEHNPRWPNDSLHAWVGLNEWRTHPGPSGMSPGVANHWKDSVPTPPSPMPHWGVVEGQWTMTAPHGSPLEWWTTDAWVPPTEWSERWHRGIKMFQANWGPQESAVGPQHLHQPHLSFPDEHVPSEQVQPLLLPVWNEVLLDPKDGQSSFVEWWNPSEGTWTVGWTWSSDPWADVSSFSPIGDVAWWIPAGQHTCLATCPHWVEKNAGVCLPADLPSLHGDRTLVLRSDTQHTSLDLGPLEPSPWLADPHGVSMARIPGTEMWASSPPHLEATPGQPNGPFTSTSSGNDPSRGSLTCSPSTLQPGRRLEWSACACRWHLTPSDDAYELTYGVVHPTTLRRMQWHHVNWSGTDFEWHWDGSDESGNVVSPGIYLAIVRWRNMRSGRRGTLRSLIGVAPS